MLWLRSSQQLWPMTGTPELLTASMTFLKPTAESNRLSTSATALLTSQLRQALAPGVPAPSQVSLITLSQSLLSPMLSLGRDWHLTGMPGPVPKRCSSSAQMILRLKPLAGGKSR